MDIGRRVEFAKPEPKGDLVGLVEPEHRSGRRIEKVLLFRVSLDVSRKEGTTRND